MVDGKRFIRKPCAVAGYIRPGGSNTKCVHRTAQCARARRIISSSWDCCLHGKCLGVAWFHCKYANQSKYADCVDKIEFQVTVSNDR